jgi:hypothetical protein
MRDRDLAVCPRRNTGNDFAFRQGISEPVGIIALVGEQRLGFRQGLKHPGGTFVIAHLTFAQQQDQWSAVTIANRVQFGIQATFGASDTSGNIPFFSRLAAVRCAFRWVASIINCSGLPRLAVSSAKIRLNTPSLLQRTKRL